MERLLDQSYARAEAVTADRARSFHFASGFLPPDKRRGVFALYDYCRHADDLVDERGERPVDEVRAELAALGDLVRRLHAGERPADARWLALWDTLRRQPVPLAPMLELLDGVAMDLGPVRMPDFPALRRYCRYVAGGVGLLLGPLLGAEAGGFDQPGVDLGIAMQLTNVIRDVAEDLDADRVYFPADELAAFGLSAEALRERRATPALRRFVAFQVERARHYFDQGDRVIDRFPADGSRLCVRLMQRTYAGILDEVARRRFDVFAGRASVSRARKLLILGQAVWHDGPAAVAQLASRPA
ncbi:MAG TPA: phytoene/squalene synthase family protein [Gemmatimonadales bacterium]|nr:phytoene/squalene synthase family protein [Gemmatimonadales bacterium]